MTENDPLVDRPSAFPWPPVIYAAALVAGWLLHLAIPLPWIGGMAAEILFAVGVLAICGGLAIDLAAMRYLARAKTTVLPHRRADHLVTGGIYAVTRNPIYLGNTLLVISAGLVSGIAWYFVLAFLAAYATQRLAIAREERHLELHFGKAYRDYKKRVNRWI
ncbi:methyltransferase family protein [Oricola sp.]|uniref:methyltransferase family protein n=1 Tax=Oricola sp. TaxID=1979950 RepID=UPI003BACD8F8